MTTAERAERRQADREQAIAAVRELQGSEGWQRWLSVRRHFHKYSLGNQLLIAMQKPDATRVAGFRAWLKLGYCVKKGEKAIRIWVPMQPSKRQIEQAAERGDPRPRVFFKLGPVFDRSQVEALPPPAEPVDLDCPIVDIAGDELGHLLEQEIPALAVELGVDFMVSDERHGNAHGWYAPATKTIRVCDDLTPNGQVHTAVHELAHALVRIERQEGDPDLDYATEELVVESVTYTVAGTLGIDVSGYAIPYLASWAKEDIAVIEAHAKLIDRLATRIEDALVPKETPA
jgi:antirestriction protein ArdC